MRFLKIGGVIVGAVVVTTLGISASDMLSGASGSLLSQLSSTDSGPCPAGMIHVPTGGSFSCVDIYEVTVGAECPVSQPRTNRDTQENINDASCVPESKAESLPWTFVAREQARALCARAGKRLPTASEWYHFAIATPDDDRCNIHSTSLGQSVSDSECVSALGVVNAVGNAWEWVSDDVIESTYNDRDLPPAGYVSAVASDGVALETTSAPSAQFGEDYFWSDQAGTYGMLRGGYYNSRTDAGVFAIQAETAPTLATVAIGFRCVR